MSYNIGNESKYFEPEPAPTAGPCPENIVPAVAQAGMSIPVFQITNGAGGGSFTFNIHQLVQDAYEVRRADFQHVPYDPSADPCQANDPVWAGTAGSMHSWTVELIEVGPNTVIPPDSPDTYMNGWLADYTRTGACADVGAQFTPYRVRVTNSIGSDTSGSIAMRVVDPDALCP